MKELQTILKTKQVETVERVVESKIHLKAIKNGKIIEIATIPSVFNLQTDWRLGYDGEEYEFRYKVLDIHSGILYYIYYQLPRSS